MQRSALCRSRRELSNAYFLAKFGFDTAENESFQVCPLSAYRSPRLTVHVLRQVTQAIKADETLVEEWNKTKNFEYWADAGSHYRAYEMAGFTLGTRAHESSHTKVQNWFSRRHGKHITDSTFGALEQAVTRRALKQDVRRSLFLNGAGGGVGR